MFGDNDCKAVLCFPEFIVIAQHLRLYGGNQLEPGGLLRLNFLQVAIEVRFYLLFLWACSARVFFSCSSDFLSWAFRASVFSIMSSSSSSCFFIASLMPSISCSAA